MSRGRDGAQRAAEIFSVIPEFDSSRLVLSPEEGFLLSRIDAVTPWKLLVEMSGVGVGHAEQCLDEWLVAGVVKRVATTDSNSNYLDASATSPTSTTSTTSPTSPTSPTSTTSATERRTEGSGEAWVDLSRVDPDLEIDVETQKRILEFVFYL